jgi:hypothetical protein
MVVEPAKVSLPISGFSVGVGETCAPLLQEDASKTNIKIDTNTFREFFLNPPI